MDIHTNIPLKNYLTMHLGGNARFMADVFSVEDIKQIITKAREQNLPFFVLGSGSNVIAHDEQYEGIIIRNRIPGLEILKQDMSTVTIKVGAGELWDEIVAKTVKQGLTGIEAMSGIPGTCGGAPVQNVGAYGQEVADTLVSLEAYDTTIDSLVTLSNDACEFSYRRSIFRDEEKGRYIITSLTFELYKAAPQPPFYAALQSYFDQHSITLYTAQAVREAVLKIRTDKLPDPAVSPNSGSFFKNALVEGWRLNELLGEYPDMPHFDMGNDTHKIPTGWLIERLGFKGKIFYGMRVNTANSLVLINESATSYHDLEKARNEIVQAVLDRYRISIEQEPIELQ